MRGVLLRGVFIEKFHCVSNSRQTWTLAKSRNRWNVHNFLLYKLRSVQNTAIGRSPGVPDKSSRSLGSMSWYSAQILICFIAYISIVLFLCGFRWELRRCTVPSAIVICNQNEAAHQTIISPSMPCWGAAAWKHSGNFATELIKLTHKLGEYVSIGSF